MKAVSINKKIATVIAILALVAILTVCLVACNNQKDFEKRLKDKDYIVTSMTSEQLEDIVGESIAEVEWAVMGMKGSLNDEGDYVVVIKCKSESDAKDAEKELGEGMEDGFKFVRKGKIVILGTEKAVEDAQ